MRGPPSRRHPPPRVCEAFVRAIPTGAARRDRKTGRAQEPVRDPVEAIMASDSRVLSCLSCPHYSYRTRISDSARPGYEQPSRGSASCRAWGGYRSPVVSSVWAACRDRKAGRAQEPVRYPVEAIMASDSRVLSCLSCPHSSYRIRFSDSARPGYEQPSRGGASCRAWGGYRSPVVSSVWAACRDRKAGRAQEPVRDPVEAIMASDSRVLSCLSCPHSSYRIRFSDSARPGYEQPSRGSAS